MKKTALLGAALGVLMLGGCATYDGYASGGWYEPWGGGYDGRDRHSRSGGGRSEPGNESGMFPGRPGDGRGPVSGGGVGSGSGDARGGEAGSR